jgi:hypothetical protein
MLVLSSFTAPRTANHERSVRILVGQAPATQLGRESPEVQAGCDLDDDDRGDHEVDGHAERRLPAGVGDEVGAMLPEVLELGSEGEHAERG